MKKLLVILMALAVLGACTSCAKDPAPTAGNTDGALTPGASQGQSEPTATSGTESSATPTPNQPEYLGYTTNNIVGVDRYGRTFDVIGGERSNKQVGMFFWLWLGVESQGGGYGRFSGVYDATKIVEEYGLETMFMQENPLCLRTTNCAGATCHASRWCRPTDRDTAADRRTSCRRFWASVRFRARESPDAP